MGKTLATQPKFNPQGPQSRRKLTPESCLQTSTQMLQNVCVDTKYTANCYSTAQSHKEIPGLSWLQCKAVAGRHAERLHTTELLHYRPCTFCGCIQLSVQHSIRDSPVSRPPAGQPCQTPASRRQSGDLSWKLALLEKLEEAGHQDQEKARESVSTQGLQAALKSEPGVTPHKGTVQQGSF